MVYYHIVVLTILSLQAEALNGRIPKVKKAVVGEKQEPKNKVNKLNDIAGSQDLIGERTKKKTTKAKASNAQSSKCKEVEEDNRDLNSKEDYPRPGRQD